MTENTDGVAAGAKRLERGTTRRHRNHTEKQTSSATRTDSLWKTERSGPDVKSGGRPGIAACPGHRPEISVITAEARTSGDQSHAAGTGRRKPGLDQAPGPNIGVRAGVAAKAERERKEVRKYEGGAQVFQQVHQTSEEETQLWTHKRH